MKVDDYDFRKVPIEVTDFKDEVSIILNDGKYQSQVVSTPPTWKARNGEFCFYNNAGTKRLYFYNNDVWDYIGYGGGYVGAGGSNTQVQVNSQGYLYADSGFCYHSHTSVTIEQDMKLVLNSDSSSNVYLKFCNSNNFIEFWLDGQLRMQM